MDLEKEKVLELLKALGRAYLENGENQKAVEKYKQLYDQGFDDDDLVQSYALALAGVGTIESHAVAVYRRAIDCDKVDESLYITLSTLFLQQQFLHDPALKVFRRSLKLSPPLEKEIQAAIERIFRETTDAITVPEIRQTLLECADNPELLSIYLSTSWRDGRFDETIRMLKDLYFRSHRKALYLNAICKTLFEKKAIAEDKGLKFDIGTSDVQFCLNYKHVSGEFKRIRDAEIYLDMRNIFSAYKAETAPPYEQEYRDLAKEASVEHLEEINAIKNTKIDFDPKFRMVNDLVRKFRKNHQDDSDINANLVAHLNTIATIEIKNFAGQSPSPNLAFKTFIDLTSAELTRTATNLTCQFEDGMVVLGSMPEDLIKMAISTLDRLDAFNKLVDKSEIIKLRITLHYSAIPFMEFENQGLKEFRKIIKIHNLDLKYARKASQIESGPNGHELMLTDSVVQNFKINGLAKLGEFRLPYFPQKHEIYQLDLANRNRPPIATPPETEPAPQARPRPQNIISKSPQAEPKTALKPLPDSESQPETEAGVEDLAPEGENNDFDAELEPQSEVQLGDETPSEEAAHPGHNGVLRQFGKYEAVRTFGENSLYTTYHGYDPHLERSVVIKAYESNAFAGFKDFDPLRKQFYEEVRKLNRINHPNIGVIYDAGEVDKTLYFVREFVEGTGINKFLRDNKIAQINEILDLYVKVCRIVSLYHQGHIWHKNLKPENVLVTDQKEIKLMDGGLLQVNNSEEVVDVDTGHICYLAPEQVRGRRLTQTCDVYQIGGLIYESLTGLNPFWAETPLETRMKIISEDPVAPSAYRIEIPEALDNIITRCLNKNPDKRYRNIGELESELRRLSASFQSDSKKRVFDIF